MYPVDKKYFPTWDNYSVSAVRIKRPEKSIVCFPSQIGCVVNCPTCISSTQQFIRSLTASEMLSICNSFPKSDLYSCMGQGDPFHNIYNVISCIEMLNGKRFALSTSCPDYVGCKILNDIDKTIKLQLSWIGFDKLKVAKHFNGEKELNVILIKNLNLREIVKTALYLEIKNIKINRLNYWDGCKVKSGNKNIVLKELHLLTKPHGISVEYYETDGTNLGASCGQMDYKK